MISTNLVIAHRMENTVVTNSLLKPLLHKVITRSVLWIWFLRFSSIEKLRSDEFCNGLNVEKHHYLSIKYNNIFLVRLCLVYEQNNRFLRDAVTGLFFYVTIQI